MWKTVHKDLKFGCDSSGDFPSARYSKTDATSLLNMPTLRMFGNELFLQIGDNIAKAPLAFLTLQSTSASLPPSLHISLPKYVNWFTTSAWSQFRTIALARGCLVVDEFTILMHLVFARIDFKSRRSCLIFKWIKHVCCIKDTMRQQADRHSQVLQKSDPFYILCQSTWTLTDVWRWRLEYYPKWLLNTTKQQYKNMKI